MATRAETVARKRRWYLANRDVHLERTRERHARKRDAIRALIFEYLNDHPCVDCGETEPIVLDFDHVGEKSFNIARATTNLVPLERLRNEIEKCVVRCANCHRRKTHRTLGYRSRSTRRAKARSVGCAQPQSEN
jgi:5-methylcytosine-specific restriction endonuclease McrA